jgi:hypothetical protein
VIKEYRRAPADETAELDISGVDRDDDPTVA